MAYRGYSPSNGFLVVSDGTGDFTTLTAALAAATSGKTIYFHGTFTENLTLKNNINLVAWDADGLQPTATIIGTCTLSTAGSVTISGVNLQTNGAFALVVSGSGVSEVDLINCSITCTNNTGISFTNSNASSSIFISNCFQNITTTGIGLWTSSSPGQIQINGGFIDNDGASSTDSTNSAGNISLFNLAMGSPISCSGTGQINVFNSVISCQQVNATAITTAGTGGSQLFNSTVTSGSASAISIGVGTGFGAYTSTIISSNTNAITGLGTLLYADLTFPTSSTINTAVQTPSAWKPYSTAGTSLTAIRGTAGFDSTSFTVTNGFVTLAAGAAIQSIAGDSGSVSGSAITIFANRATLNSGSTVSFVNSGTVSTFNVTDASSNTIIGKGSGSTTLTATQSTSVGAGNFTAATFSGVQNGAFGQGILPLVTSGNFNLGCGADLFRILTTGSTNLSVGYNNFFSLLSGSHNLGIGSGLGNNYTSSESDNILIGTSISGTVSESNTIRIGAQGTGSGLQNRLFMAGITSVTTTVANRQIVTINSSTTQMGTSAFSVVYQVFTANGTYTPTSGMLYCAVRELAGGAAGGGAQATGASTTSVGGGGGGGEYAEGVFSAATIGASQSVTIGAGGVGSSGAVGGNGGNSAFGALLTTNGGTGGATVAAAANTQSMGGAGGTGGSGGSIRSKGYNGLTGVAFLTPGYLLSGQGANSQFGSGALGIIVTGTAGAAAAGFGAGGSGGANYTSQSANAGGNGTPGYITVTEYVLA